MSKIETLLLTADQAGTLVNRFPYVMTSGLFAVIGFGLGKWTGLAIGLFSALLIVGPFYFRALKMAKRHRAELAAHLAQLDEEKKGTP